MNFATSTHKARWIFTREQLHEIRSKTNEASATAACDRVKKARTDEGLENASPEDAEGGVTPEDERRLLRFYEGEIAKLCARLHYPVKVKATAIMYFKRFFLYNSCITQHPMKVMLTCVYLAGKIEESYIGAEEFCRLLNQDIKAVLSNEVLLLQGLRFDLIVHSPYRALAGLIEDIKDCQQAGPSSGIDEALLAASPEQLERWRAFSVSAVDALMMSDAPLQHPPGQLALAALRSGLRKDGIRLSKYLERAVAQAEKAQQGSAQGLHGADCLTQLLAALDDIDKLGMEGAQKVDVMDVQAIDKRLKAYRAPADSDASKLAGAAAEKERAERREAKAKARREQQAAAEARLLGMPQQQ